MVSFGSNGGFDISAFNFDVISLAEGDGSKSLISDAQLEDLGKTANSTTDLNEMIKSFAHQQIKMSSQRDIPTLFKDTLSQSYIITEESYAKLSGEAKAEIDTLIDNKVKDKANFTIRKLSQDEVADIAVQRVSEVANRFFIHFHQQEKSPEERKDAEDSLKNRKIVVQEKTPTPDLSERVEVKESATGKSQTTSEIAGKLLFNGNKEQQQVEIKKERKLLKGRVQQQAGDNILRKEIEKDIARQEIRAKEIKSGE